MESKRTQASRTAATRAALVAAARPLFAERGFAAVGTDEIARAAGVTRGALYHQFAGKTDLFAAVFETVEAEIAARLAAALGDGGSGDPVATLHDGIDGWLAACADPEVHRIVLIEAPAALGWERWREIGRRYGVGLVEAVVQGLLDAGRLPPQPVLPLAHVLVGALEEAALFAARADDRAQATADVRAALVRLVDGLVVP
ncbi:TetR family transcriptional regulator [Nocardioides szechwanensis]|uniref:Transcriptional regulator, TetR family n=1 Tax=Nocardioides szechwanensis TaxID=1005944 RepID=A0A1G9V144_9ACTN|nr:TetR/AcrR family transcriptional regulator [Nocardioides szechwanensis]GEP33069.1 TetR family transcriptional regulator [Nocardioides szechwanensis]SDM65942.1 transcriptional regulator, TetR family [Nocardioides szechwanensis]